MWEFITGLFGRIFGKKNKESIGDNIIDIEEKEIPYIDNDEFTVESQNHTEHEPTSDINVENDKKTNESSMKLDWRNIGQHSDKSETGNNLPEEPNYTEHNSDQVIEEEKAEGQQEKQQGEKEENQQEPQPNTEDFPMESELTENQEEMSEIIDNSQFEGIEVNNIEESPQPDSIDNEVSEHSDNTIEENVKADAIEPMVAEQETPIPEKKKIHVNFRRTDDRQDFFHEWADTGRKVAVLPYMKEEPRTLKHRLLHLRKVITMMSELKDIKQIIPPIYNDGQFKRKDINKKYTDRLGVNCNLNGISGKKYLGHLGKRYVELRDDISEKESLLNQKIVELIGENSKKSFKFITFLHSKRFNLFMENTVNDNKGSVPYEQLQYFYSSGLDLFNNDHRGVKVSYDFIRELAIFLMFLSEKCMTLKGPDDKPDHYLDFVCFARNFKGFLICFTQFWKIRPAKTGKYFTMKMNIELFMRTIQRFNTAGVEFYNFNNSAMEMIQKIVDCNIDEEIPPLFDFSEIIAILSNKSKGQSKRAALFLDCANINTSLFNRLEVNYYALVKEVLGTGRFENISLVGIVNRSGNRHLSSTRKHLKEYRFATFEAENGIGKINGIDQDDQLLIDKVMEYTEKNSDVDSIILMSGDGHYLDTAITLREKGINVIIVCFSTKALSRSYIKNDFPVFTVNDSILLKSLRAIRKTEE